MKHIRLILHVCLWLLAAGLLASCTKQGPEGLPGNPGSTGAAGAVGPAGKNGSMLLAGAGAPDENTGAPGDYYLDEGKGDLYGPKVAAGWGSPFPFSKRGAGGNLLAGSDEPDSSVGMPGDFYLDTTGYTIYGPKAAGGWNIGLMLNGSSGSSGVTAYVILKADEYMTGVAKGDEEGTPFYLFISFDSDHLFDLWNDVNEKQDLLAVYLKQKIPVYGESSSGEDSVVSYENLVSSANGTLPVAGHSDEADEPGRIAASCSTGSDGIQISFFGEYERCNCVGIHLLQALENDLGLKSILVFVISPTAVQQIGRLSPAPPGLTDRQSYQDMLIQRLITSYLK